MAKRKKPSHPVSQKQVLVGFLTFLMIIAAIWIISEENAKKISALKVMNLCLLIVTEADATAVGSLPESFDAVALESENGFQIDPEIKDSWTITVQWPSDIVAESTDLFRWGVGRSIRYNISSGTFYGWGIRKGGVRMETLKD